MQKAKQKSLTGTVTAAKSETKNNIKNTMIFTGRDVLIGAIGGGLAGALVGRSSLLVGLVVTGAGHYLGSSSAAMFGVGMMASGGYQTVSGAMNGTAKDGIEGVKERFSNFQDNLKRQLFLDKIKLPKKKKADETTDGMGNVQYFKHPGSETDLNGKSTVDLSEMDHIESQINESAKQFAEKNGMSGEFSETETNDISGLDGEIEERLI